MVDRPLLFHVLRRHLLHGGDDRFKHLATTA